VFGDSRIRLRSARLRKRSRAVAQGLGRFPACGKSDPIDAEAAARAALAGTATGVPKDADGEVEMIRTLRITRRSAVKARAQAANQLQALLVTAPEGLKSELGSLSTARVVETAARLRPGALRPDTPRKGGQAD
jgi:Transposase